MAEQNPERYFYPDQYNNDENWIAHFETTGAEIIEQTRGRYLDICEILTGSLPVSVSR